MLCSKMKVKKCDNVDALILQNVCLKNTLFVNVKILEFQNQMKQ
jgi:hypothetical protein